MAENVEVTPDIKIEEHKMENANGNYDAVEGRIISEIKMLENKMIVQVGGV
jgi:hypothetical protein